MDIKHEIIEPNFTVREADKFIDNNYHWHQRMEFLYVEKGYCNVNLPMKKYRMEAGDDISKIADIKNKLASEFEAVMFKYIVGQDIGDSAWNKWVKKTEQLGANEQVQMYNNRHKELGL